MKKILLATTLLAMTAGYASAEVAVSGSARMGVVNVAKAAPGKGTETKFSSRVRIGFAGSGTTDGGLTFGASMRADQDGGNTDGTANGSSTVNVSGAFGTLTMGDVAGGASDNLVGQVSGVGFTGNGDNNEIGFLGGKATAARYNFSAGAFSLAVGVGQPTAGDDAKSIAMAYTFGNFAVAVGYSDTKANSQIDAKGTATFGPIKATLRLAQRDKAVAAVAPKIVGPVAASIVAGKLVPAKADASTAGSGATNNDIASALSLDYTAGALTVTAFVTKNHDFAKTDTSGLGASYDLGGGASVLGGVADDGTNTVFDLGVSMSF